MVKDSKTGDFGNYDFSRKNQNFEWKTTLKAKFLEAMYENNLEFPGGRRGAIQKSLPWGEDGFLLELHI